MTSATLLVVLAALGLTAMLLKQAMDPETLPALSLGEVLQRNLVMTRVSLSVLLVVAWPLVLHGAAEFLKLRFKRTDRFLTLTALFLGGLTYVVSFLPGSGAAASLLVPVAVSPFLFHSLLRMTWGQAVGLWATQLVSLGLLIGGAAWGIESVATQRPLNPMKELPVIYKLLTAAKNSNPPLYCAADGKPFPAFRWESSGSDWIDLRANQAKVVAILGDRTEVWGITLQDVTRDVIIEQVRGSSGSWHSSTFVPGPDFSYFLSVDTGTRVNDLIKIYSLWPVKPVN